MRTRELGLALALLLAGCDDGGGGGTTADAAADAAHGGDQGVTPDAARDAGPDAARDAAADAAPDAGPAGAQALILGVPETEQWTLPGLTGEAYVVRTEDNIPHIYARTREDVGRVLGFELARDRYFSMDLVRRLGTGTVSELLGEPGLASDEEGRGNGMAYVTDRMLQHLSPELGSYLDAVAAGVNAYIDAVRAGKLPAPSELQLAHTILGGRTAADLMKPFDRRSFVAVATVLLYESNFETGDVGRAQAAQRLDTLFAGAPLEQLRRDGFRRDVWDDLRPLFPDQSAAGLGLETPQGLQTTSVHRAPPAGRWHAQARPLPSSMLQRLSQQLQAFEVRFNRDHQAGFGSNAWAVAGAKSTTGGALIAGDGHLQLSVPALLWQFGLDTTVFGGGDLTQAGLMFTSLPLLAEGTSGHVAWSQVNPVEDVTDWYREEIQLDAQGKPVASKFHDEWKPLVAVDETYNVADVPLLGSHGRTETWTRYTTFDGRFLADVEGRAVDAGAQPEPGHTIVNMRGHLVEPGDTDGDGVVTAISFDYTAFDATSWLDALDHMGRSHDMEEFRQSMRGIVGGGLFTAGGDDGGHILYSSYQAIPCRQYLEKGADGYWTPGSDPMGILDGTVYGGFTLATKPDGTVDDAAGAADPYACAIPFDQMPQALDPAQGYVFTANNDPGGLQVDGDVANDRWYLGADWDPVRADTIHRDLEREVTAHTADIAGMAAIQADSTSRLGELFTPDMLRAIDHARDLASLDRPLTEDEQRLVAPYQADAAAFDEVERRLQAWGMAGYDTPSGVETFYHHVAPGETDQAVATMIFNAWFPRVMQRIFDDEPIQGTWRFSGDHTKVTVLTRFLRGRGPGNTEHLASFNPDTNESVFFDDANTPPIESSDEEMLLALADGLAFLRSPPNGPGDGGFGTPDMNQWLWGLRHMTRFESLVAPYLNDPALQAITDQFSITTHTLPLADNLADDDPRKGLKWFPRPSDEWAVNAGNPGLGGTHFTHGNGPVMRMVIELKDGHVRGQNIIPGGQSGLADSPFFADQVRLWLAQEALPLRFHPEDVAAGATGRETFKPE